MRLYAKTTATRERVFFIRPQTLEASSKNALAYGGWSSGSIIYAYVGGQPVSRVDPDGRGWREVVSGAVVGGVFGALGNGFASWTNGSGFFNKQALKNGFIGGAIGGAIAVGANAPAVGGAVGAAITDALNQRASLSCPSSFKKVNLNQTAFAAAIGGTIGATVYCPRWSTWHRCKSRRRNWEKYCRWKSNRFLQHQLSPLKK